MKNKKLKILISVLIFLIVAGEFILTKTYKKEKYALVRIENVFNSSKYVFQPGIIKHYLNVEAPDYGNYPLETFDVEKKKNSLRIICLGGTSASGFPFEKNATSPFQLQFRLRNALLDDYVEVINMAMPGISSTILKDLMPEILALEPDQLIFYLGDDELFTQYELENNSRSGLNLIHFVDDFFKAENEGKRVQFIPKYLKTKQNIKTDKGVIAAFKSNYKEIISLAQQNQTQVLLSSIPVNNRPNLKIINKTIAQVAKEKDVPFVDMVNVFDQAAQNKKRILFDAIENFTFKSQTLMAQTFFQALYLLQFKNPKNKLSFKEELLSKADIETIIKQYSKREAGVTDLNIQIGKLKARFVQDGKFEQPGNDKIKRRAIQYLQNKLSWQGAHYELAEDYITENNFDHAFKVYRAVNLSYYEDYIPHMKIADLFFLQQEYQKSKLWLGRAIERSAENVLLNFKMGQTLLFLNDFNEALSFLEKSTKNIEKLKIENIDLAYVYYLSALCYANLKNWMEADKAITNSLLYNNVYKPTLLLKEKIINYPKD